MTRPGPQGSFAAGPGLAGGLASCLALSSIVLLLCHGQDQQVALLPFPAATEAVVVAHWGYYNNAF